jgi:hypothetical protein
MVSHELKNLKYQLIKNDLCTIQRQLDIGYKLTCHAKTFSLSNS